jgi:Amt family ammonium transporter
VAIVDNAPEQVNLLVFRQDNVSGLVKPITLGKQDYGRKVFNNIWSTYSFGPDNSIFIGTYRGYVRFSSDPELSPGPQIEAVAASAALVAAVMVGARKGYPQTPMTPHNMTMCLTGTGMLWVGWFGFNGGSALAANGNAAMAILVTQTSASVAALTWSAIEWVKLGKPSALGFATGAIAGLAAVTPASGFIGPEGACVIGLTSGAVCWWAATQLKIKLGYDDALDVLGVHGVGGLVGVLLVAVFASSTFGGNQEGLDIGAQLKTQSIAAVITILWTALGTYISLKIASVAGLRVDADDEEAGLDLTQHTERGYDL